MKTDIEIAQEAKMKPIPPLRPSMELLRTIWNFTESTRQRSPMSSGRRSRTDRMENSFW